MINKIRVIQCQLKNIIYFILFASSYLGFIPTIFAGEAILSWNAATTNTDNSCSNDLAGYRVYYGSASENYSNVTDVGSIICEDSGVVDSTNCGNILNCSHTVTTLADGDWYFAITSYDEAGNESDHSNEAIKTIGTDTTPPQISGIYTSDITTSTVTINWTTNEISDTQVEYGMTNSYGYSTTLNPLAVTVHNTTIYGLAPSTEYHFRVRSSDENNNTGISSDLTFTTASIPDTFPPLFSNIAISNIGNSVATIAWMTDEPSTSRVEYGENISYGNSTTTDSTLKTNHSVQLTGLSSSTTYNFRAVSLDENNNEGFSSNSTFDTSNLQPAISTLEADATDVTAPAIVSFSVTASDPDGFISSYEWDFDGDGTYDANTGTLSNTSHNFTTEGLYNVIVRVRDNGGATTESTSLAITVSSYINEAPTISSVVTSANSGPAPLSVTYTVDARDIDGTISMYEWDFDGNGSYDATTSSSQISFNHSNKGNFDSRVKIYDDDGATATTTVEINVTKAIEIDKTSPPNEVENVEIDGGGCFIATAAYGSYLHSHVNVLRKFRDNHLTTNVVGRLFVKTYYKISPPIADIIARNEILKSTIRFLLTPIILSVVYLDLTGLIIIIVTGMGVYLVRTRKGCSIKNINI